jgi:hypothetical protein
MFCADLQIAETAREARHGLIRNSIITRFKIKSARPWPSGFLLESSWYGWEMIAVKRAVGFSPTRAAPRSEC